MAAVTVNSITYNVSGSLRQNVYNVTIATSGDTLDTNLAAIKQIAFNDVAITKAAPGTGTTADVITFTTTGAVTAAEVLVTGY